MNMTRTRTQRIDASKMYYELNRELKKAFRRKKKDVCGVKGQED